MGWQAGRGRSSHVAVEDRRHVMLFNLPLERIQLRQHQPQRQTLQGLCSQRTPSVSSCVQQMRQMRARFASTKRCSAIITTEKLSPGCDASLTLYCMLASLCSLRSLVSALCSALCSLLSRSLSAPCSLLSALCCLLSLLSLLPSLCSLVSLSLCVCVYRTCA
jgi:hypothetical protein